MTTRHFRTLYMSPVFGAGLIALCIFVHGAGTWLQAQYPTDAILTGDFASVVVHTKSYADYTKEIEKAKSGKLKIKNMDATQGTAIGKTYDGALRLPEAKHGQSFICLMTLVSDDGCEMNIDNTTKPWLEEYDKGHDILNGARPWPSVFISGKTYDIQLHYCQKWYKPGVNDQDGISVILCVLPIEVKVYQPESVQTPLLPENPIGIRPYEGSPRFYKHYPRDDAVATNLFALWPAELAKIQINGLDSIVAFMPENFIQWESDSASIFEVQNKKQEVKFAWNNPSAPCGRHWIKLSLGSANFTIYFDVPDFGQIVQTELPGVIGDWAAFKTWTLHSDFRNAVKDYVNDEQNGVKNDALKHGTWSAWMAQEFDAITAKIVGNAHEGTNKKVNKDYAFNSTMNQHNNNMGRGAWAVFNALSPGKRLTIDELIPIIDKIYKKRELWVWWPKTKESNQSDGILRQSDDKKIK